MDIISIYIYMCVYTYIYICAAMFGEQLSDTYRYIHLCVNNMYVYIYIYMHALIQLCRLPFSCLYLKCLSVCLFVCLLYTAQTCLVLVMSMYMCICTIEAY